MHGATSPVASAAGLFLSEAPGRIACYHPRPTNPRAARGPRAGGKAISKRIYVGNLSFTTTKDALVTHLSAAGEVTDAHLPSDRETGKPRGFGFVEFSTPEQAQAAIDSFDGKELDGRALRINLAEERRPRSGGGPGGGGGGGGYRGGGGGRSPAPYIPFDDPPPDDRPYKSKGSRRGARRKKRSLN